MVPLSKLSAPMVLCVTIAACAPDASLGPESAGLRAAAAPASFNHAPPATGITIHDPAFTTETIVAGLYTPQGSIAHGRGLTFIGISETGEILRVTHGGGSAVHAQVPLLPGRTRKALAYLEPAPDGGMYASDLRQGAVFRVDGGGVVSLFSAGLAAPYQLGLDTQDRIYVAELSGRRVSRLAPDGSRSTVVEFDVAERPTGLVVDDSDNMYILSGVTGRIRKFVIGSPEPAQFFTLPVVATVPGRSDTNRAENLTFGPGGDLFVMGDADLYRVSLVGAATLFATGFNGPFNTVSAATNDDLVVTEFADSTSAGRVLRIRPARGR